VSNIQVASWPASQNIQVAILGDVVDLALVDARMSPTFAVVSAPGGSSATFSGSTFQPDVVGQFVFSITEGSDIARLKLNCFSSSIYSSLANLANGDPRTRTDQERRGILRAISVNLSVATLNSWNSGTWPSLNLAQYGG
jgi:hypothetical protein